MSNTNNSNLTHSGSQSGLVLRTTRRNAHVVLDSGQIKSLSFTSKVSAVAAGDVVTIEERDQEWVVSSVLPRKNALFRSYRGEKKVSAANLDRLFLVSAVKPLFNTHFIDRVLVFCSIQGITPTLILNKIDLDLSTSQSLISIYQALEIEMLYTSALDPGSLIELRKALTDPELKIVALAGISGVGKSSLLNQLLPGSEIKTAGVSSKTGQGRRTTSQAIAYSYPRPPLADLLIIDLPGVHAFGVADLSERLVAEAFPEFFNVKHSCEFLDCYHLAEPHCGVKSALASGQIAPSRYQSYIDMIQEIRAAKPY